MGRRGKSRKAGSSLIGSLWGYFKLCLLLCMLGVAAAAVWYSQQDPHTQERARLQVLEGLNWLIERDETDPQADAVLRWIVEQLPGSAGGEVAVDAIESLDRFTFAGIRMERQNPSVGE